MLNEPLINLQRVRRNVITTEDENKVNFKFHKKKRIGFIYKPHKMFFNWSNGYKFPIICILECSIMILYILLTLNHQSQPDLYSNDFNKILDDFFFDGYGFPEREELKSNRIGEIYYRSDFIRISNQTAFRFFEFSNVYPCTKRFYSDNVIIAKINLKNGIGMKSIYSVDNVSEFVNFVNNSMDEFKSLEISMKYFIEDNINERNIIYTNHVTVVFDLDINTHIIKMDALLNWNQQETISNHSIISPFLTLSKIIPIFITIFSTLSIIFTLKNIFDLYKYSQQKALKNFQNVRTLFLSKFDRWNIFSIISHVISIISCMIYTFNNTRFDSITHFNILIGISTMLHSCLMTRYLKQKPSTLIVINVLFNGGVSILLFLFGSFIIFIGYILLGIFTFGPFLEEYSEFIKCFSCLFAIIYGDSIQLNFDIITSTNDVSSTVGFIYILVWVFFSITVMFNIMISLYEEALSTEIYKAIQEEQPIDNPHPQMDRIITSLPLHSYRNIFKN